MPKHRAYTISGVKAGQVQESHDEASAVNTSKRRRDTGSQMLASTSQLRGTSEHIKVRPPRLNHTFTSTQRSQCQPDARSQKLTTQTVKT
jgi:hypothetical protein